MTSSFAKDTRQGGLPYADDQGMPYIAGAGHPGVSVQMLSVVQVGASPYTVDLEAAGGKAMAGVGYWAEVKGTGAGAVDQSSLAAGSLDITGGADTDVYQLLVIGALAGQPTE